MRLKLIIALLLVFGIAFGIVSIGSADPNVDILYPSTASDSTCIGSSVYYSFRITNTTPIALPFNIYYSSIWPYDGPEITPTLAAGGIYDFQVSVYIPWTAHPGEYDVLSVTVMGGGYSGSSTATTTAKFINDWIDLANTPRGARFASTVYSNGRLYKIGGEAGGAQPWVDIFDTGAGTWSQGADMPEARYWIDCQAIQGKIYCGGGSSGPGEKDLFIYDIGTNTWSYGPDLPYAVYSYASVSYAGKYYLIGGYISGSGYSNAVLVYDPLESIWDSSLPPMTYTRRYHSAGVIDGNIVVAGGYNGVFLDSVEALDLTLHSWTNLAPMPSEWVNAADGVTNDRYLILAGGSSESIGLASPETMIYDSVTNVWNWLPEMDHAIYGAEGDSDGTNFWLVSGQIFIDSWTASPYTTLMDSCETTCPSPVTGADFTWSPLEPWTGYTVELNATTASGSEAINFAWSFSDGSSDTGQSIEHIFTEPLTYSVEVTASSCDGASISTKTHDITVLDPPTIEATPTGLNESIPPDQSAQKQLVLCNEGDVPLSWEMSEIEAMPLLLNGDLPWLSESVVSGVIPADTCISIDIFFSSLGLEEGIYLGILSISNNDPALPLLEIPVSLTVASAGIDLVKTISLSEGACGSVNQLNVYPNTTVYYCYTVTNIGGVLLDYHNLTDDRLGDQFNSLYYPLPPGASFYYVTPDPVLITETVTNGATWHAVSGDFNAVDTASATVTLIPEPDFWVYLPSILKLSLP